MNAAPAGQLHHACAAARAGEPARAQLAVLAHKSGARKPLRIALREAHAHLRARTYCSQHLELGFMASLSACSPFDGKTKVVAVVKGKDVKVTVR